MTFCDSARMGASDEARIDVVIGQSGLLTHDRRRALLDLAHAPEGREEVVGHLDRRDATAEACANYLVRGGVTADGAR